MRHILPCVFFLFLVNAVRAEAQTTVNGSRDITGSLRVSGTTATIQSAGALPGTCNPGPPADVFLRTSDNTIHRCSATNTWTQVSGGGGGAPSAHASTHMNGGGDEVASATPAANAIPKAGSGGRLQKGWEPPAIEAAGAGYFFPIAEPQYTTSSQAWYGAAKLQRVFQFVLPHAATFGKISADVMGGSGTGCGGPGGQCGLVFAIRGPDCDTILAKTATAVSGGTPDINTTGVKTLNIVDAGGNPTAVTLNPGVYYLAASSDSTSLVLRVHTGTETWVNADGNSRYGYTSNPATGDGGGLTLPATCGTITPSSHKAIVTMFQR